MPVSHAPSPYYAQPPSPAPPPSDGVAAPCTTCKRFVGKLCQCCFRLQRDASRVTAFLNLPLTYGTGANIRGFLARVQQLRQGRRTGCLQNRRKWRLGKKKNKKTNRARFPLQGCKLKCLQQKTYTTFCFAHAVEPSIFLLQGCKNNCMTANNLQHCIHLTDAVESSLRQSAGVLPLAQLAGLEIAFIQVCSELFTSISFIQVHSELFTSISFSLFGSAGFLSKSI